MLLAAKDQYRPIGQDNAVAEGPGIGHIGDPADRDGFGRAAGESMTYARLVAWTLTTGGGS